MRRSRFQVDSPWRMRISRDADGRLSAGPAPSIGAAPLDAVGPVLSDIAPAGAGGSRRGSAGARSDIDIYTNFSLFGRNLSSVRTREKVGAITRLAGRDQP